MITNRSTGNNGGTTVVYAGPGALLGTAMAAHGMYMAGNAAKNLKQDLSGEANSKSNVSQAEANRAENKAKGIPASQLGPSGKPKVHNVEKPNLKSAKDAARNNPKSNSAPVKHTNDKGQKTHFHSTKDGEKLKGKDNVHYVDKSSKKTE